MRSTPLCRAIAIVAGLVVATSGTADEDLGDKPAPARPILRIGTSGDYPPFSEVVDESAKHATYEGFDIAVATAYARDRGFEPSFVRFRWPDLVGSMTAGRFDVAMSGITVRPERSTLGRFTVPVAETGAVILGRPKGRFRNLDDYNRRPVRIGVNKGGHLERVAEQHFPRATLLAIPDNTAVLSAFLEGQVDAAVTDTLEAPNWMMASEDLDLHGPFTRDRKAYWVRADRPELAADLDAWLLDREADGTLGQLREVYFGLTAPPTANTLRALVASIDERLTLMPIVAIAKRRSGLPLEVPAREAFVLDAAVDAVEEAARKAGVAAPDSAAVRGLFRAQMEAAKQVQWDSIQDSDAVEPESVPDVDTALRPALIRIGDRIAQLLIRLPTGLGANEVKAAVAAGLRAEYLTDASRQKIARALMTLIAATSPQLASEPDEPPTPSVAPQSP